MSLLLATLTPPAAVDQFGAVLPPPSRPPVRAVANMGGAFNAPTPVIEAQIFFGAVLPEASRVPRSRSFAAASSPSLERTVPMFDAVVPVRLDRRTLHASNVQSVFSPTLERTAPAASGVYPNVLLLRRGLIPAGPVAPIPERTAPAALAVFPDRFDAPRRGPPQSAFLAPFVAPIVVEAAYASAVFADRLALPRRSPCESVFSPPHQAPASSAVYPDNARRRAAVAGSAHLPAPEQTVPAFGAVAPARVVRAVQVQPTSVFLPTHFVPESGAVYPIRIAPRSSPLTGASSPLIEQTVPAFGAVAPSSFPLRRAPASGGATTPVAEYAPPEPAFFSAVAPSSFPRRVAPLTGAQSPLIEQAVPAFGAVTPASLPRRQAPLSGAVAPPIEQTIPAFGAIAPSHLTLAVRAQPASVFLPTHFAPASGAIFPSWIARRTAPPAGASAPLVEQTIPAFGAIAPVRLTRAVQAHPPSVFLPTHFVPESGAVFPNRIAPRTSPLTGASASLIERTVPAFGAVAPSSFPRRVAPMTGASAPPIEQTVPAFGAVAPASLRGRHAPAAGAVSPPIEQTVPAFGAVAPSRLTRAEQAHPTSVFLPVHFAPESGAVYPNRIAPRTSPSTGASLLLIEQAIPAFGAVAPVSFPLRRAPASGASAPPAEQAVPAFGAVAPVAQRALLRGQMDSSFGPPELLPPAAQVVAPDALLRRAGIAPHLTQSVYVPDVVVVVPFFGAAAEINVRRRASISATSVFAPPFVPPEPPPPPPPQPSYPDYVPTPGSSATEVTHNGGGSGIHWSTRQLDNDDHDLLAEDFIAARRRDRNFGSDEEFDRLEADARASLRRAAKKWHPDRGGDAEAFADLTSAYNAVQRLSAARRRGVTLQESTVDDHDWLEFLRQQRAGGVGIVRAKPGAPGAMGQAADEKHDEVEQLIDEAEGKEPLAIYPLLPLVTTPPPVRTGPPGQISRTEFALLMATCLAAGYGIGAIIDTVVKRSKAPEKKVGRRARPVRRKR